MTIPAKQEKEMEVKVPPVAEEKVVEVNLEPKKAPDPAAEEAARKKAIDDAAEKEKKRLEYLARKFDQGIKEVKEIVQALKPQPPAKSDEPVDEIDQLAEKDWKLGVKELTETVLEEREQKAQEAAAERARLARVDQSANAVRARYPNIEDASTEEGALYLQAMNQMAAEDPRIYKNEYGPVLVMHRMEEMMREAGKVPPVYRPQVEQEVDSEVQRRQRIGAGSLPAGRQTGSENIVVLTAEEQQLCKENGITFERYAAMKRLTGKDFRDGVSVK